MTDLEKQVVEHVLQKLIVEIDQGYDTTVLYTTYNHETGTSSTQQRKVNLKHGIVSAVTQKLLENKEHTDAIYKHLDEHIQSKEFKDDLAAAWSNKMINWLNETSTWSDDKKNRTAFNVEVRKQTIKIIAQRKADKIMEDEMS